MSSRIGFGYDSHRLVEGRRCIIGGVEIAHPRGLEGHSDADVLCHAIIDAVLGALGEGDIGQHFPDTDPTWKGADSVDLLKHVVELTGRKWLNVEWIDATIIAEAPKLAPHIEAMKNALARAGIPAERISIKAKTNEGMGFIGRGEGVAAYAVCLLSQ